MSLQTAAAAKVGTSSSTITSSPGRSAVVLIMPETFGFYAVRTISGWLKNNSARDEGMGVPRCVRTHQGTLAENPVDIEALIVRLL